VIRQRHGGPCCHLVFASATVARAHFPARTSARF